MSDENKFFGITFNQTRVMGKVVGDPTFMNNGEHDIAFFNFKVLNAKLDANGQWVQHEQIMPIYVIDSNRVEKLIRPHIQDGRQLYIECYYESWEDGNGGQAHGFIVTNIQLGNKPFTPKEDQPQKKGPALPR